MAADFDTVQCDFKAMLAHLTGLAPAEWTEKRGPNSGSGLDYWYETEVKEDEAGLEAYINVDQTTVSISVYDEDGETLHSTSFDFEDTPADHWANGMVTRHVATPSP